MEFDKSRIFTTLNADELKIGSKVIVSDNLSKLKEYVHSNANICTLKNIEDESCIYRFGIEGNNFILAYLIEEPEGPNECEVKEEDEPLLKAKTKDCNITVDRHILVDTILALQTDDRVSKITIWDSPYSGFTVTFTIVDE